MKEHSGNGRMLGVLCPPWLGSSVRILSVSEKVFYFGFPWADQVQDFSKFDPLHTMSVDSHTIFLVASLWVCGQSGSLKLR